MRRVLRRERSSHRHRQWRPGDGEVSPRCGLRDSREMLRNFHVSGRSERNEIWYRGARAGLCQSHHQLRGLRLLGRISIKLRRLSWPGRMLSIGARKTCRSRQPGYQWQHRSSHARHSREAYNVRHGLWDWLQPWNQESSQSHAVDIGSEAWSSWNVLPYYKHWARNLLATRLDHLRCLSSRTTRHDWHQNRKYKQRLSIELGCVWCKIEEKTLTVCETHLISEYFQDKDEHLDLLEGVLIDLLKTKWETFVKAKFYRQFYLFAIYFFISLFAFGLRPKAIGDGGGDDDADKSSSNNTREGNANDSTKAPVKSFVVHNLTEILCNFSAFQEAMVQTETSTINATDMFSNSTMPTDDSDEWTAFSECPLLDISTLENRVSCPSILSSDWTKVNFFLDETRCWRLIDHRSALLHLNSNAWTSLSRRKNVLRELSENHAAIHLRTMLKRFHYRALPHRESCFYSLVG